MKITPDQLAQMEFVIEQLQHAAEWSQSHQNQIFSNGTSTILDACKKAKKEIDNITTKEVNRRAKIMANRIMKHKKRPI